VGHVPQHITTGHANVHGDAGICAKDGTGSPGQRFWPGQVGSQVSVSNPAFDPVLSFNMLVYHGVVSTE